MEALVASSLTLLLFGVVLGVLGPSLRASSRSLVQADLQQQVDLVLRAVEADLHRTVGGGVGLLRSDPALPAQPVALGLVRLEDVASDGRQVWERQAVLYVWEREGQRLVRLVYPPPAGPGPGDPAVAFAAEHPPQLAPEQLLAIATRPSPTRRVLATGVRLFEVTHAGTDPAVSPPLTLTLELERTPPGHEQSEVWTGTRRVSFRLSRLGG